MAFDTGDTAWMILCTALVLLMSPGLAVFYAGMVRSRHVLSMIMYNLSALVVISVTWVLVGFSLAFGPDAGNGLVGGLDYSGLANINDPGAFSYSFPPAAFVLFQMMFAVITGALITGAAADRMRFPAMVAFLALWSVLVYPIIAHWAWGPEGWMAKWGVLDFAGGTVVEICSGASAFALAIVLGRRLGWPREPMPPHNLPLTILGAGLLWFGWIGFNAGSALSAGADAASAALGTHLSGVGGVIGWLVLERRLVGKPTALGAASGAVAGLVAITPAAGFLDPLPALLLGVVAGAVCMLAVKIKFRLRVDDSLDVLAIHFFGGVVGMLFLGFFARALFANGGAGLGLLAGGDATQLGRQTVAIVAAAVFAFGMSLLLAWLVKRVMDIRVQEADEVAGIDYAQHGESAYEIQI
ncbi:MAG: ammonium transporter [Demequinaceae bacterium]|nr:ammonium transporter [Demequinaceae bacterium]